MRFGLRHLLAITTLFAVLLAIATSNGAINRDGVWTVESVTTEDWGGSWHGMDPVTGESCGGAIVSYIAMLRDGDRIRFACFGDDADDYADLSRAGLPTTGDSFVFTGAEMSRGKPIFPGSSIYTGPPPGSPTYFAIDDHTLVLPARPTDGYSRIFNVIAAFLLAVLFVVLFAMIRGFIGWAPTKITGWLDQRRERREHYRRTHIV